MSNHGDQLLNSLTNIIEQSLPQTDNSLKAEAHEVATQILNAYQGQQVYFPKSYSNKKALLHKRVKDDFNGKNQVALAKRYRLSTVQIYNITRSKT